MPSDPISRDIDDHPLMDQNSKRPTLPEILAGPAMLTVPAGGWTLGLKRSASYAAAKSGYLPTVRLSEGRYGVPVNALVKKFWNLDVKEGGGLQQE